MLRKLATGTAVLGLILLLALPADAQRRGGRGGGWWSGSNWGGHDGFSVYTPGFGFTYGDRGYYGYPYYGGYYGNNYYRPYYGGYYNEPFVYSQPYSSQPYYSEPYYSQPYYSSNMPYSQGYEEAEQGAQPAFNSPRPDEAMVRVIVPHPEARVMFDGNATQQRGTERMFMTTLPDRNKDFTYTIRASWTENGREMNRERKVKVRAGQQAMVDFRRDSGTGPEGTIRDNNNRDPGAIRDNNRDERQAPPRPNDRTRDNPRPEPDR